jgi:hypothetical protein
MTYTNEQLNKMLLPQLKIIAKELGIPTRNVRKSDLIARIFEMNEEKKGDDDILEKSKKILKKYIKSYQDDDISVNTALKHLSSKLTDAEKEQIESIRKELKKYIKQKWYEYEEKKAAAKSSEKKEEEKKKEDKKEAVAKSSEKKEAVAKSSEKKEAVAKSSEKKEAVAKSSEKKEAVAKSSEKKEDVAKSSEKKEEKKKEEKASTTEIKKYTVAKLKEYLVNIGVKESLRGKLKADFTRYANGDRCYPDKGEFCEKDGEVCDIRNNLCVLKEDIPVKKELKKYEYNGYVIYGTDEQLKVLKKKTTKMLEKSLDDIREEDITDVIITFINSSTERISNVVLVNKIKESFGLESSLADIQNKFFPFLKSLYKDVKDRKIGYSCENGICRLTRDVSSIKYKTIEECKEKCKKLMKDTSTYFACVENKCTKVAQEEAEYKSQTDCDENCDIKPTSPVVKKNSEDMYNIILKEFKDLEKPKFDEDIEIMYNDKKITLNYSIKLKKPKLVKEVDSIMYTGIFYEDMDKRKLNLMKCLGLVLLS